MTRSALIFIAAAAAGFVVAKECKRIRDIKAGNAPRPGAHVPLAPDAGTVEARGGANVVTDKQSNADAEAPAIFTPPTNA